MGNPYLFIPIGMVLAGVIMLIVVGVKSGRTKKTATALTDGLIRQLLPDVPRTSLKTLNTTAVASRRTNDPFQWLVAYTADVIYLLPAKYDPTNKTMAKQPDTDVRTFPIALLERVAADVKARRVTLTMDDEETVLSFQPKDMYGLDQATQVTNFFKYMTYVQEGGYQKDQALDEGEDGE